jgi:hypothetical protein
MKARPPPRRGQRKPDDLAVIGHAMKMRALLDYFSAPVNAATETVTIRPGPPLARPSQLKPFWQDAHREAQAYLEEHGFPLSGDGGQATLERHIADWLEDRGHTAAESTIRGYVSRWIKEYRDRLNR